MFGVTKVEANCNSPVPAIEGDFGLRSCSVISLLRNQCTLQDVARPNLSVHFDEQYAVECRGSRFGMEKPPVRAAIEVQAVPFHYPGQINVRSQVLEDCNDTQAAFRSRFDTLDQNSEFGESNLQGRQHVGFNISYGPGVKMLLRFLSLIYDVE